MKSQKRHRAAAEPGIRRRRLLALLSGGVIIGVGGGLTLATWTDSEWVWGGADADSGMTTSTFEVVQNTSNPFNGTSGWLHEPTNPGGALIFDVVPAAMAPGDVFYAPVALTTTASSVAGTVLLQPAVAASGITVVDDGDALWDALELRVVVNTAAVDCDVDAFEVAAGGTIIVDGALADGADPGDTQTLTAAGGNVQHYCFEITLPNTPAVVDHVPTLQGRSVAPAWQFLSESI